MANDNFHKGGVLMMQAIKYYNDGDFAKGDKNREEANRFYDLAMKEVNSAEGQTSLLYGENRNFGIIMHVIEECMKPKMLATKQGKSAIRDIAKEIRGDKILRSESKVYASLIHPTYTNNPNAYVDTALSLLEGVGAKRLAKANDKVIKILREHKINELIDIDDDTLQLYEDIENAILKRGSLQHVDEFVAVRDQLIERVKNNVDHGGHSITESLSKLNDDELNLIETIETAEDGGKAIFAQSKREALEAISRVGAHTESENKEALNNIYEQIEQKEFDPEKALIDIAEFNDITNTLRRD